MLANIPAIPLACSLGDCLHVLSSQNMLVMVLLAGGFDHLMRSPGADFFALSLDDILHEPQVAITKANTGAPGRRAGAVSAVGRFLLKTFGRGEIGGGRLGGWREIGLGKAGRAPSGRWLLAGPPRAPASALPCVDCDRSVPPRPPGLRQGPTVCQATNSQRTSYRHQPCAPHRKIPRQRSMPAQVLQDLNSGICKRLCFMTP